VAEQLVSLIFPFIIASQVAPTNPEDHPDPHLHLPNS